MKWIPETHTLELTDRNVQALRDKLDDPLSARTISSPCRSVYVTAVESPGAAEAAVTGSDRVILTRSQLDDLAVTGTRVRVAAAVVISVPDEAHYADRPPGPMFMPTSGEYR